MCSGKDPGAALAVLCLSLGEWREVALDERVRVPIVVSRHPVEIVQRVGQPLILADRRALPCQAQAARRPGLLGKGFWVCQSWNVVPVKLPQLKPLNGSLAARQNNLFVYDLGTRVSFHSPWNLSRLIAKLSIC